MQFNTYSYYGLVLYYNVVLLLNLDFFCKNSFYKWSFMRLLEVEHLELCFQPFFTNIQDTLEGKVCKSTFHFPYVYVTVEDHTSKSRKRNFLFCILGI